jgi:hypothetical protein
MFPFGVRLLRAFAPVHGASWFRDAPFRRSLLRGLLTPRRTEGRRYVRRSIPGKFPLPYFAEEEALAHIRFLLLIALLTAPVVAHATQKQCGAETCGTPTKGTKTINGVLHNCTSTTCSKSCCTLGDPPVCSVEKTTTSDCTPAKVISPGRTKIDKFKAPSADSKQQ